MPRPRLAATVLALGWTSFCNDVGSEMVVPLLPVLLGTIGGSRFDLGLVQGASDLAVAVLRLASGWLSDRQRRRKPWIVLGYAVSALLRPCFAATSTTWQMAFVRAGDRVGKGLRSAPRDALVADVADVEQRGAAYGAIRALDHAGALVGALLAAALLALGAGERAIFALAALPGVAAVSVLAFGVREPGRPTEPSSPGAAAPGRVRPLLPFLAVVALGAFGAGIDLFLLARAGELGVPAPLLPLLWALLHLVRAAFAAPLGAWSDRLGRRRVLAFGLLAQALVLAAFAAVTSAGWLWPLFAAHGLHAAFSDGAERGYVADLTGAGRRGTVFGVFHGVQGLAAVAAPLLLGSLWDHRGAAVALFTAAAASVAALLVLLLAVREPARR